MDTQHTSRTESFSAFKARYKPLIRPDETLPRMRRALSVDAEFLAEFEVLRSYLRPMLEGWTDSLLGYLQKFPEFKERFGFEDHAILRALIRKHARNLAVGQFDERYLDSLEEVALFFIYYDVKSIWVAGAYQAITRDAIDIVFTRATDRNAIRIRQLMKILVSALALELNQIQRVYIIYERRQYAALIEDLKSGAFLTTDHGDLDIVDIPMLDPASVLRVQDSYGSLRSQADLLAKAFCKTLFTESPEARVFAGDDRSTFATGFTRTLATLVGALSDPETLAATVTRLGAEAAHRGATPDLYGPVERALLRTLERASGAHWRPEDAQAWQDIYRTLTIAMTAAMTTARAASAAPATLADATSEAASEIAPDAVLRPLETAAD